MTAFLPFQAFTAAGICSSPVGGFAFGLLLIKLFANRVHTDYEQVNRLPVY